MNRQTLLLILSISIGICYGQENENLYNSAINLYETENYIDALEEFKLAKQKFQLDQNSTSVLECAAYMMKIYSLLGQFKNTIKISDEALSKLGYVELKNDSLFSLFLNNKALALRSLGDFKLANKTVDVLLNSVDNEVYLANAYQTKSRIQIDLGEYNDAILSAKKAIILNADQDDTLKAALFNIVGVGFYFKEDLDSTLYYYDKSYKLKLQIKADHYDLAITTYNLGIVQEDLGDYKKAIEYYKKAAQHDLLDRGESVGFISDIYLALCNTYVKKNDLEKAEEFADKAL